MKFKEVAISLQFKMYFDCPGVVVDYRTKQEYPYGALNTDILVYEDRVKGWFLNYGHMLQSHHDAGFVVLQIATAQIEDIKQYRRGESSRNKSSGFFCDGLKRIFSLTAKDDTWLCEFYDLCRCGLFHDGMIRGRVIIENDFPLPLEYKDNCILVSVQDGYAAFLRFTDSADSATGSREGGGWLCRAAWQAAVT